VAAGPAIIDTGAKLPDNSPFFPLHQCFATTVTTPIVPGQAGHDGKDIYLPSFPSRPLCPWW
jgi:hypothetical protein